MGSESPLCVSALFLNLTGTKNQVKGAFVKMSDSYHVEMECLEKQEAAHVERSVLEEKEICNL